MNTARMLLKKVIWMDRTDSVERLIWLEICFLVNIPALRPLFLPPEAEDVRSSSQCPVWHHLAANRTFLNSHIDFFSLYQQNPPGTVDRAECSLSFLPALFKYSALKQLFMPWLGRSQLEKAEGSPQNIWSAPAVCTSQACRDFLLSCCIKVDTWHSRYMAHSLLHCRCVLFLHLPGWRGPVAAASSYKTMPRNPDSDPDLQGCYLTM
jgi:hypothetical protein